MTREWTPEQKQKISEWVAQGNSLAEIQKKLASEFQIGLTYMEVRLVLDDLRVTPKNRPTPTATANLKAPPAAAKAGPLGEPPDDLIQADDAPPPGGGQVRVDVDRITKPGSVVSGTVVFSDGTKAGWMVDSMGRLGLSGTPPNYRPNPTDIHAFQAELDAQLRKRGF